MHQHLHKSLKILIFYRTMRHQSSSAGQGSEVEPQLLTEVL